MNEILVKFVCLWCDKKKQCEAAEKIAQQKIKKRQSKIIRILNLNRFGKRLVNRKGN